MPIVTPQTYPFILPVLVVAAFGLNLFDSVVKGTVWHYASFVPGGYGIYVFTMVRVCARVLCAGRNNIACLGRYIARLVPPLPPKKENISRYSPLATFVSWR